MKKKNYDHESSLKVPSFKEEAGFYSSPESSERMSKIRAKDTNTEIKLRKALWSVGCRYRLHAKNLVGKPDLVFVNKRLVVFIDGRFWHGYNWEVKKKKLEKNANKDYWIPKIEKNMERDIYVTKELTKEGWKVLRIWEHEVENDLQGCVSKILALLQG